jgi:hypothetical protein
MRKKVLIEQVAVLEEYAALMTGLFEECNRQRLAAFKAYKRATGKDYKVRILKEHKPWAELLDVPNDQDADSEE